MHNHPLIVYPEGHRQASGLSPAAKQHVRALRRAHTKPANIQESLRQNFPSELWLNVRTDSVANWPDLYTTRLGDWVQRTS